MSKKKKGESDPIHIHIEVRGWKKDKLKRISEKTGLSPGKVISELVAPALRNAE